MLSNLSPAQTLVLLFSEVIPSMFILLPACTGGIAKSLQMYSSMAGTELPAYLPGVLALCITSAIAGVGKVRRSGRQDGGCACACTAVPVDRGPPLCCRRFAAAPAVKLLLTALLPWAAAAAAAPPAPRRWPRRA